jgi:hypothetical protein
MRAHRRTRSALIPCTVAITLLLGNAIAAPAVAAPAPLGGARSAPATAPATDCRQVVRFDRHNFPHRPKIDNKYSPLVPGARIVLSGTVRDDDGFLQPHEIRMIVSNMTKVIAGVRTVVVFERDFEAGVLQESELAFVAQDKRGTVWNVGEYPEVYEDGEIVEAPTWFAGIAHAKAGVSMPAHPRRHTAAYLQGLAPSVGFRDCGQVVGKVQRRCENGRCFHNVLVIDEFSPNVPQDGHQLKYYAPKIGNIEVGAVGGVEPEVLQLASYTKLSRAALARVNKLVVAQDRRGYRVSPSTYGRTPRMKLYVCRHHGSGRGHDEGQGRDCR